MSIRTALLIDGDSSGGQKALKDMESAIGKAEAEAKAMATAFSRADITITKLAKAQAEAKAETDATKAAFKAGEIGLEQYNRQMLETKSALGLVQSEHRSAIGELNRARAAYAAATGGAENYVRTSGAVQAGTQQLGFQFSDFAVQMAGGTSAIRAFTMQGPQAVQAIALMGQGAVGTTGKFAAFASFLGGPWGAAVTVGVSVAGALATALLDVDDVT